MVQRAMGSMVMATKKTASAKKTTTKKKTASKGPARSRAAARPAAPAAAPAGRSGVPLAVLAIMALLAVIALMINNLYLGKGGDPGAASGGKETRVVAPRADEPDEKESPKREAPESKQVSRESGGPSPATVFEAAKIYFVRHDERDDGLRLVPVTRKVAREKRLDQALRELVRGPTAAEKKRGLLTAVPPDLRVRSVKVSNRVAEVDFNGVIEEGAAGSILINRVDQIIYTLTEFPDVDAVLIKVNGSRRNTLGADGLSIGAPRTRSR